MAYSVENIYDFTLLLDLADSARRENHTKTG